MIFEKYSQRLMRHELSYDCLDSHDVLVFPNVTVVLIILTTETLEELRNTGTLLIAKKVPAVSLYLMINFD